MKRSMVIMVVVLALALGSAVPGPGTRSTQAARGSTRMPNVLPPLGNLLIQPKMAHIGDWVTISGRTTGRSGVTFLPPFVLLQTAKQKTVHLAPGPMCGGTHRMPVATYIAAKGGGSGTRSNPPSGTKWRVRFKMPPRMSAPPGNSRTATIRTPLGKYYADAIGVGADYCVMPMKSNGLISVGSFTIIAKPANPPAPPKR